VSDKLAIRTSDRNTFRRCRMLWDFSSPIRKNYSPTRVPEALEFGTAFHSGLEEWYNPETWHFPADVRLANALAVFSNITEEQRAGLMERMPFWSEEDDDEFDARLDLGLKMVHNYCNYSAAIDKFTPLLVEYEFEIPLYYSDELGRDVVYQGKIDMVVEDEHDDVYVWDHKTANRFDSTEWLDIDTQISSYCWAMWKLGYDVKGFVYNQVYKGVPSRPKVLNSGKLSKDKNQSTTPELFRESIEELGLKESDYTDFLEYLEQNPREYIRRTQVDRSDTELEIIEGIIYSEARDMVGSPWIYPNPSLFNCRMCEFKHPCMLTLEGSDPFDALEDPFQFMQNRPY